MWNKIGDSKKTERKNMNGIKYVKCELCGKQDKAENLMLIGGCFAYLCPSCRKVADKVIKRFIAQLRESSFELVVKTVMDRSGK